MGVTAKNLGLFIVWPEKDMIVEEIKFDEAHWDKVSKNLYIFVKGYICPFLLGLKHMLVCGLCKHILLDHHEKSEK